MGWEGRAPPDRAAIIASALNPAEPLIDPLVADAEERWNRGLPARLDDYAAVNPLLMESTEACRALLMCEASRRTDTAPEALKAEFAQRFPALAAEAAEVADLVALMREGAADAPSPLAPGTRVKKYELLEAIGRGGFGEVWRARDHDLHRYVALKFIPVSPAGRQSRRGATTLIAEARAAAAIDHENVVRVHDTGVLDDLGLVYIDSQLAGDADPGPDDALHVQLAKSLEEVERPPAREAARIIEQACRAIGAAHARGVLHRDIKPGNILLSPSGRVLVTDFGLAVAGAASRPGLSNTGRVVGTPAYMAPEQARGESVTPLSEVYALGATLRFLLTGLPPYQPSSRYSSSARDDVLEQARRAELGPVVGVPGLPRTLVAIANMATAGEPSRRYQTPLQMADDLRAFLEFRPTTAAAPGTLRQSALWVRRHRLVTAIAAAGLALSAAVGATTFQHVLNERDRATAAEQRVRVQRDDARAANQFFKGMLGRTISGIGPRDATIVQGMAEMDRNASRILENRPLAEAAVRSFLADERFESAEAGKRNAVRAWELFRDGLGRDAPETLAARRAVLTFNRRRDAMLAAVPELEQLRDTCARVLGKDDPETLRTELMLCSIQLLEHEREVLPRCEALLTAFSASPGASHADIVKVLDLLSVAYGRLKQYDRAAAFQAQAVDLLTKVDGPDGAPTLSQRQRWAMDLVAAGRRDEAREQFRLASEGMVRVAPDSNYTAVTLASRAIFLRDEGERTVPIALLKEAIARTRPYPDRAVNQIHYLLTLGNLLIADGQTAEGAATLREALVTAEGQHMMSRPDVEAAQATLARLDAGQPTLPNPTSLPTPPAPR